MKGWCNSWKLCFSLPIASCTSGFLEVRSEKSELSGARAPYQFWVLAIRRLLPSGDLLSTHLICVRTRAFRPCQCEKVCCSFRQLRQTNIHSGGHVDTRICLISAHFSASGSSAAPSEASRVNCYFKRRPLKSCPMNRGQCLFTSPAKNCPNILARRFDSCALPPTRQILWPYLFQNSDRRFLWHRTQHFEDKRLRSMAASPWCGCPATLVWQPSLLFPYKLRSCDFVLRRFLYTSLWGKRAGEKTIILPDEETSDLSFLWLLPCLCTCSLKNKLHNCFCSVTPCRLMSSQWSVWSCTRSTIGSMPVASFHVWIDRMKQEWNSTAVFP